MLSLRDVHVRRGRTHVLRGLSLTVGEGEIVTLIGPNGAGKSTTLMSISGLLPVSEGGLHWEHGATRLDLARASPAAIVGAGIIHCPEGRQVFARLTVQENLELGGYLMTDATERRRMLGEVYQRFPVLGERRGYPAGSLSGGEQMMLALGRALMARPRLLLLDEPSLGLAPRIVEEIVELLQQLHREQQVAILLIEQNALLALEFAQRGYVLEQGQIVESGSAAELRDNPRIREAYLGVTA